ncbi:MAG: hypothetical protein HYX69_11145 [Planctomycetia bacterium]|nr:hypothetical protein [Planctomycetia bacterium]
MFEHLMTMALLLNLADPAQAAGAAREVALHPVEEAIVTRTNAERQRHGLPVLEVDVELVRSARHHAAWMTRTRTLRHTTKAVAENIAMGQTNSQEAVRSWMNSPGHRANILSPGHRKIGVAAYTAADGTVYWCQQFVR